jgi:hypothetical protein
MLSNMIGGTISKTKMTTPNTIMVLFILFLFFIIKVILVQWSYNTIFPTLRYNVFGDENYNFQSLTFFESVVVVILFNCLFQ